MLSVLQVYRTYYPDPPGGLQEAIRQIALATSKHGLKNTIFTLSPRSRPQHIAFPEADVVRCRSWCAPASCDIGGLEALRTYQRLIDKSDVIHHFFPWPFADVLHTISRPKTPAITTYISDIVRQRLLSRAYAPLMWQTLGRMRHIVANCDEYLQTSPVLSDPSIRKKVTIIPLGIDESSYPRECDKSILGRLGIEPDTPYFLFIGALRYYKGLTYLIESAKHVRAKIVVVGDGPENHAIRRQAAVNDIRNVIFAGRITNAEKVALLKFCRALVLPSHLRAEAFGMVLVEASMYGRPMLSCNIGSGTSYVNLHEETGLVVPPASPYAIAEALNILLNDPAGAESMGRNARSRYEKLFSGPALGKAYAELFQDVARRP